LTDIVRVLIWQNPSEYLPEYMDCVLIENEYGQVLEAQYTGDNNIFAVGDNRFHAKYWMPLPPPPSQ
jgi:hypothetical protein